VADQIFVMLYDDWHHHEVCAGPNSPLPAVLGYLDSFISHGADRAKLVAGFPWYGYEYRCNTSLQVPSPFKSCDDPGLGTPACVVGTLQVHTLAPHDPTRPLAVLSSTTSAVDL
jgi:hypothetical protein